MSEQQPLAIFDGHNDVLLKLFEAERGGGTSFLERRNEGHIDLCSGQLIVMPGSPS